MAALANAHTRRKFLATGAAASAAVVFGGVGRDVDAQRRRKRVVILGAGLAGLVAAHELQSAGVGAQIVLLEARGRVGGRVHTVRTHRDRGKTPFADGQYAEVGAQRIPDSHERVQALVATLGLDDKLVEFSSELPGGGDGVPVHVLKGSRFFYDGIEWPEVLDLTDEERGNDLFTQAYPYEYDHVTGESPPGGTNHLGHPAIGSCQPANWPPGDGVQATLEEWDELTLAEFLASNGASADWRRLYAAQNGTEIFEVDSLAWLAQTNLDFDWFSTLYLNGGLDQIPKSLADRVRGDGASLRLGNVVRALEQGRGRVDVSFRDKRGHRRTLEADRVICTVPFPVLRREVNLKHARLDADKLAAIRTVKMVPAGRIALQMDSRFWQDEGIEGLHLAWTDTELERIWHSTNTQPGDSGIVQAYLQGENARAAATRKNRFRYVRDGLSELIFPQADEEWNGLGVAKLWQEDRWARGAWMSPKPKQFLDGFHVWGRREGRIHFAGEHTSLHAGWMEGAIESGQRVACEVAAAL